MVVSGRALTWMISTMYNVSGALLGVPAGSDFLAANDAAEQALPLILQFSSTGVLPAIAMHIHTAPYRFPLHWSSMYASGDVIGPSKFS